MLDLSRLFLILLTLSYGAYFMVQAPIAFALGSYASASLWLMLALKRWVGMPTVDVSRTEPKISQYKTQTGVALAIFVIWVFFRGILSYVEKRNDHSIIQALDFISFIGFLASHRQLTIKHITDLMQFIFIFAISNASVSIFLFWLYPQGDLDRLAAIGRPHHPILGAASYAIALGFGIYQALIRQRSRQLALVGAAILLAAIWLSGSRGVVLAIACATFATAAVSRFDLLRTYPFRSSLIALVAVGVFILGAGRYLANRGDNNRIGTWLEAVEAIRHHPVIGSGITARIEFAQSGHAHNILIGTAFTLGAVGLVSLLVFLACRLREVLLITQPFDRALLFWLMVLTLVAGIVDFGQIVRGPTPTAFVIWLPLLLRLPARTVIR